jgi:hypothetical protein
MSTTINTFNPANIYNSILTYSGAVLLFLRSLCCPRRQPPPGFVALAKSKARGLCPLSISRTTAAKVVSSVVTSIVATFSCFLGLKQRTEMTNGGEVDELRSWLDTATQPLTLPAECESLAVQKPYEVAARLLGLQVGWIGRWEEVVVCRKHKCKWVWTSEPCCCDMMCSGICPFADDDCSPPNSKLAKEGTQQNTYFGGGVAWNA